MLQSKFKSSYIFLYFSFVIILNLLKPWLAYFFSFEHQQITIIQFIPVFFYFVFFNSLRVNEATSKYSIIFLLYIIIRFAFDVIFKIFNDELLGIMSSFYVVIRSFIFVSLISLFGSGYFKVKSIEYLRFIYLLYFSATFIYSLMQHPLLFDIKLLKVDGANVTSGNELGFFRANGAIGGTAIDYANYLLAVFWLLLYAPVKKFGLRILFFAVFIGSAFLCFSRALFLAILIIGLIHLIFNKKFKNFFPFLFFALTALIIVCLYLYFDYLVELNVLMSGRSDEYRLSSWNNLFSGMRAHEFIFGKGLGSSTGLFLGDLLKNNGDGFIQGFIYDSGIFGICFFIVYFFSQILGLKVKIDIKLSVISTFFLMIFVNSGFDKLYIVFIYALTIGLIISNGAPVVKLVNNK